MDWFEYAIIGSGPAGVAAARRLSGAGTCLIDVGAYPSDEFSYPDLTSALQASDVQALLGSDWEMLANLVEPRCQHPKLRAPLLRFVMQGEPFQVCNAAGKTILQGAGSYAAGGMSNAWGAQLLRYTDKDLEEVGDWPFSISVLQEHYADLEAHAGIAGQVDDMQDFLGNSIPSMPSIPLVPAAQRLYDRYQLKPIKKSALLLGQARLALATAPHQGRAVHSQGETDFFSTGQPGMYTARCTLEALKGEGSIAYLGGHRLLSWKEHDTYVELRLQVQASGQHRLIRARHLLLGCGTIQTAKMVLRHHNEHGRSLPFIDHPPTLLPLFLPRMFGAALPERSYPIQLIATLPNHAQGNMISLYYPGGILWSDLLPDVLLPLSATVRLLGSLLGGMLVAQIWQTSRATPNNRLHLDSDGMVIINYPDRSACTILPALLRALLPLGVYSSRRLASYSPPGWGFHHAGCLPMRSSPEPYETHVDGRLWNSKRVRVIDGSVLPSLPAKNHTLTLMANAARIADEVRQCGF